MNQFTNKLRIFAMVLLLSLSIGTGHTSDVRANVNQSQDGPTMTINICGATTKAGHPCKRRVKVKGTRCFMHKDK
jgi:hypothetical protein